ncbi:hypothetical protein ACWGOQ_0016430 [Aquimarina sp. M1]
MKLTTIILLFNICVSAIAQPEIINKTFIAKIGSICEEFSGDAVCAGQDIYIILQFYPGHVIVIEDRVDSCGATTSELIDGFQWSWIKNKHWVISFRNVERTQNTILENIRFIVRNGMIIGEKLNQSGFVIEEYHFIETV